MERFTVTEQHLKLVRSFNVGWQDTEYGAPEIDPKRPYGNSNVRYDIAEILNIDPSEADWEVLEQLHRDTDKVLQIAIDTGKFEAGTYQRNRYGAWGRVS